jgi:methylated-DNA-protein-cysteine methyltransferase-like protein
MDHQPPKDPTYQQVVYAIVRQIPSGLVASYGQIARIAGGGISARMVGYALAALPQGNDVPWQRVINSQGKISLPSFGRAMQEKLLQEEGVDFGPDGRVDFERFGWNGPNS